MVMLEVRANWSGTTGGPGVSTFHFNGSGTLQEAQALVDLVRAYFQAHNTQLPNEVSITVDNEVRILDSNSGQLVAVATVTAPPTVTGLNTSVWAGGVGSVTRWNTGVIVAGRRLIGRTFMVPLASTCFEQDGTVSGAFITLSQNAANALVNDSNLALCPLVVWSRTHLRQGPVQGATVPNRSAILRTRRD